MNRMKFSVTLFNYDDEVTSEHRYANKRTAEKKYDKCVTSAQCANVGRVKLYERIPTERAFGMPFRHDVLREWYDNDRTVPEPEDQLEGYIVHSVRSLNGKATTCRSVNKTFHETTRGAVRAARQLADKWSEDHEGLIVFKAVKHVKKVERTWRTKRPHIIRVTDLETHDDE